MKILYKSNMSDDEEKQLINEISILSDLDHPNIIKMYEYFQDEKRYYIITEWDSFILECVKVVNCSMTY